ncbi:hypothetical protein DEU56DRAFT_778998 [Suillus clintonianus]|uniref:uncharacterized protein n=1 Tax=Suillus clintonianus TaxID=1904413 RepID=UPI001B873C7E|nr:uncharacterized protein DEU56DRAFT_778998 [Suillus clintonianus]KAG2150903.1 hypothetical protein DEU56DRAFT_778998 [Suillus clintonianus]
MIHVKWDRETLHFPLPPPETKLGKLRTDLAEYTHLPLGSFKLIHAGAVMKDDSAPLTAYKIRENSTIALIGGHSLPSAPTPAPSSRPQPKVKEPPTEQSTITAIRTELDRVRTSLVPDVDALVSALAPSTATTVPPPTSAPTPASGSAPTQSFSSPAQVSSFPPPHPTVASYSSKPTSSDHTRLSELLLQSLLRLDAMHLAGSDWPEARAERKAAVREVQGVLDRLDGAWSAR